MRDSSLDRLVREHLPAALRFATRLTGNVDQAEEVVQEALYRVARGWAAFRGEASFRTWLFGIVINVFRDRSARRGVDGAASETPLARLVAREPTPDEAVLVGELAERVAAAVSRLPPRQREVLVLVVYEGLSPAEAARAARISEGNVYAALSLARARLQTLLSAYLNSIDR